MAKELLQKLQEQLLFPRWQLNPETRATVQSAIKFKLNELPDKPYPETLWTEKVEAVWQFVYHHMGGPGAAGSF